MSILIGKESTELSMEELATVKILREKSFAANSYVIGKGSFDELIEIPTTQGTARILVYRNSGSKHTWPIVFNLHGGGFMLNHAEKDDSFCRMVADSCNVCVFSIDYQKAPENPFPAALNQVEEVVKIVVENAESYNVNSKKVVIVGHSSGGNISLSTAIKMGDKMPFSGIILDYPPLDLKTPYSEKVTNASEDGSQRSILFNRSYIRNYDGANPLISPVFATDEQLNKLPKLAILTAGKDTLRSEALTLGGRLQKLGKEPIMIDYPGANHGFTISQPDTAEAKKSRQDICDIIVEFLKD